MDQHDEGSCQHYLYTQFLNPAGIKPNQIQFFNARAENLAEECARLNEYIARHGPLDIMLVGLGMNGHLVGGHGSTRRRQLSALLVHAVS